MTTSQELIAALGRFIGWHPRFGPTGKINLWAKIKDDCANGTYRDGQWFPSRATSQSGEAK